MSVRTYFQNSVDMMMVLSQIWLTDRHVNPFFPSATNLQNQKDHYFSYSPPPDQGKIIALCFQT